MHWNLYFRYAPIFITVKVYSAYFTEQAKIVSENSKMTSDGLRVIAVCYRDDYTKTAINENNMVFIGLIGIEDPPRKEAKQSVELCKRAGIRPVMITGDHAETALSVAKKSKLRTIIQRL